MKSKSILLGLLLLLMLSGCLDELEFSREYDFNIIVEDYNQCEENYRQYQGECIPVAYCEDNTLEPECSVNKPFQCIDNELVENIELCGCPLNFRPEGNECIEIQRCKDNTEYGLCSPTKPLFCEDGILVQNAGVC